MQGNIILSISASAGAYTESDNALYRREVWLHKTKLEHVWPKGVLDKNVSQKFGISWIL